MITDNGAVNHRGKGNSAFPVAKDMTVVCITIIKGEAFIVSNSAVVNKALRNAGTEIVIDGAV